MQDNLKEIVTRHREEFDYYEPSPDIWEKISKKIDQDKKHKVNIIHLILFKHSYKYAAAILLLAVTVYAIKIRYDKQNEKLVQNEEAISLEKIAPEIEQVEIYYTSLINQKKAALTNYDIKPLDDDSNISFLDSAYTELKKELHLNPGQQKVIDAMIQNLQIRINILNQQLEILNRVKQRKNASQNEEFNA